VDVWILLQIVINKDRHIRHNSHKTRQCEYNDHPHPGRRCQWSAARTTAASASRPLVSSVVWRMQLHCCIFTCDQLSTMVYRCDEIAKCSGHSWTLIARPHAVKHCNIYVLGLCAESITFNERSSRNHSTAHMSDRLRQFRYAPSQNIRSTVRWLIRSKYLLSKSSK